MGINPDNPFDRKGDGYYRLELKNDEDADYEEDEAPAWADSIQLEETYPDMYEKPNGSYPQWNGTVSKQFILDSSKSLGEDEAEWLAEQINETGLSEGYKSASDYMAHGLPGGFDGLYKELWKKQEDAYAADQMKETKNESAPYKPVHEYEDFEDARYYPTKSNTDENGKWIGKHYSVAEAHGLTDANDTPEEFNKRFKHVGNTKDGADIFQGPDGYFSGNPRINSMAFKTKEALQEYMENMYGKYAYAGYGDSDPRSTGPEAYKKARSGATEAARVSKDADNDFKVGDSWNWPAGDFLAIKEEKDGKYKIDSPAVRHGLSKEEWLTKDELNSRIKGSRKVMNGLNPWHGKGAEYYAKKPSSKTGTEVFENLKKYVGGLSDDEKEMLLELLKYPRKK